MLDNVGLRYPHRASRTKAPRTLRPLPLLRFAVSATGDVVGFEDFFARFTKGLPIEHAAIETINLEDNVWLFRLYCIFQFTVYKSIGSTSPK